MLMGGSDAGAIRLVVKNVEIESTISFSFDLLFAYERFTAGVMVPKLSLLLGESGIVRRGVM